jgi:hypothetical protein
MRLVQTIFFSLVCCAPALAQVQAQEPEPKPIIVIQQKPADPTEFSWLGDAGVKLLTDDIAQHKAGSLYAFVFAGAPSQAWSGATDTKESFVSLEELARRAVGQCEYYNRGAACFILSINGNDAHDANGVLPVQPLLLSGIPKTFDATRVPFMQNSGRQQLTAYARAARPRALIVSTHGWWQWNTGNTVLDAIAQDQESCKKHLATDTGDVCVLYAVNDQVVFAPENH